jgi:hypothetical protein
MFRNLKYILICLSASLSYASHAQVYEITSPKQSFDINKLFIPSNISIPQQVLAFNEENNNHKLDAGETVEVKFRVENAGAGLAKKLKLSVVNVNNFKGIEIIKPIDIPRVLPNDNTYFTFKIKADDNIKTGDVLLKIKIFEPNGLNTNELEYSFKTLEFLKPELKIIDPIFSSVNTEKLERKRQLKLDFIVQNTGQGIAENIIVNIEHDNNIVTTGKKSFNIDKFSVGQDQHFVYEFIVPECETKNNNQDCDGEFAKAQNFEFNITVSENRAGIASEKVAMLNLNTASGQKIAVNQISNDFVPKKITTASLISDIDKNIPQNNKIDDNKIAVIIGNENYSRRFNGESDVAYAINDANSIFNYLTGALGFKSEYCFKITDASKSEIQSAIVKMIQLSKTRNGEAELFFYYAGHGIPDAKKNNHI